MNQAEDLELLHALQLAPRASWRSIGSVLHRSPASLSARWEELTSAGLAWCSAVPLGRHDRGTIVFVALLSEPGKQQALAEQAILIPDVTSIEEPATHWDLMLSVRTPNIEEFLYRVLPRIAGLEGLARHETIICTRLHFAGHEWRLRVLGQAAREALDRLNRFSQDDQQEMRAEDRSIIPILFRDGRATVSEISAELGMHSSTISRRLTRVLSSPSLSLRCDIAPEMVGQPISCQWFGWLPPEQHGAAASVLRTFPNMRFCASTTGQTNFTFVIWASSPDEIFEIERKVVERIDDISISESSVTVRFIKRMGWRLDPKGRRVEGAVMPRFSA